MRRYSLITILFLSACGGTLTDEQRKKVKEDMKEHAIKKVSDAQITETAFSIGRSISLIIEKKSLSNKAVVDSLQQAYHAKIVSLKPGAEIMKGIEKQIIDAYTTGSGQVELSDNIQKLGTDSLLYTKPIMKELPDGSLQFNYAIGIRLAKKEVVLAIKD